MLMHQRMCALFVGFNGSLILSGNVCVVRVGFWLGKTRSLHRGVSIPWLRGVRDYGVGNMRVIIRSAWGLSCLFSAGNRPRHCLSSRLRSDVLGTPTKCKRDVCFPRVIDRDVDI